MKELSIITLSNKGYIDYTTNLINSIKTNKVDMNVDIHVMDSFSLNYFQKLKQNVFLIKGMNNKRFLKQDSADFGIYMLQKLKIIHQSLHEYKNVIYLDGDIVIKKNFLDNLKKIDENYDLIIQNDKNPKKTPYRVFMCWFYENKI